MASYAGRRLLRRIPSRLMVNELSIFYILNRFHQKSIVESKPNGESMEYFWSSFIGIGIANTFFHEVCVLVLTIF